MDEINEYEKIIEDLESKIRDLKEELEKNKKIKDEIYDKYLKLKNIFNKSNEYNKLLDELKIILLEINLKLKEIDDIKKGYMF